MLAANSSTHKPNGVVQSTDHIGAVHPPIVVFPSIIEAMKTTLLGGLFVVKLSCPCYGLEAYSKEEAVVVLLSVVSMGVCIELLNQRALGSLHFPYKTPS